MSIDNINSSNFPGKSVQRTDQPDSVEKGNRPEKSTNSAGSKPDQVQISSNSFASDIEMAKNIFTKLETSNSQSLKQVRENIESGLYNSDKVREQIIPKLEADLQQIQSADSGSDVQKSENTLTPERIEFLTRSVEVENILVDKLVQDLKNI